MPSKKTIEREKRVNQGVNAYEEGETRSIRAAARKYDVHHATLTNRINRTVVPGTRKAHNRALNDIQESVLIDWIKFLDNHGFSPTKNMVVNYANEIRQRDIPNIALLSRSWGPRWLKKQQQSNALFIKKSKSIEAARQAAFDQPSIQLWFDKLHATILEHAIQPDDILNFDETGYRIGTAGDQTIVTFHPDRRSTLPNDTNHEHITLTETISAGGWVIPPVIIISGVLHLQHYFQDLPDGYLLAVSDSGYTNNEISLATIKHIDKFSKLRQKGASRLLLLDNHECHLSLDFLEYCEGAAIIPFALPPHTTHFLQPLDVGCFQPNKHWHRTMVNEATRMGNRDYSRLDFFADLPEIRHRTFKESTICSAFKKCGVHPFNPAIVLEKLKEFEPQYRTPTPENQEVDSWHQQLAADMGVEVQNPLNDFEIMTIIRGPVRSPENAREIITLTSNITTELLRSSPEIPIQEIAIVVKRLGISAAKRVSRGQIAEKELLKTTAYQTAKQARKRAGRKRLQTGGVLYAENARAEIAFQEDERLRAEDHAQEKALRKQQKKRRREEDQATKQAEIQARKEANAARRAIEAEAVAQRKAARMEKKAEKKRQNELKRAEKMQTLEHLLSS
jgi:hypothetical protein